jgi:hypothetical protein
VADPTKAKTVAIEDVASAAEAVTDAVRDRYSLGGLLGDEGKALIVSAGVPAALVCAGLILSASRRARPWAAVAWSGAGVWVGLAFAKWMMASSEKPAPPESESPEPPGE